MSVCHHIYVLAEWSERLTPGPSGRLGAAVVGSIPALVLSHSLKVSQTFTSLSRTSLLNSSRCPFSCHSPLCLTPVRPGCLFCVLLSLLSPFSQPQIDRVSSNRCPKARHEANIYVLAEWSERLTPGPPGWLGVAVIGSIPVLLLSHSPELSQKLDKSINTIRWNT